MNIAGFIWHIIETLVPTLMLYVLLAGIIFKNLKINEFFCFKKLLQNFLISAITKRSNLEIAMEIRMQLHICLYSKLKLRILTLLL